MRAGLRRRDVRLQFAGSDELAAQIRQGVPVDVFAAANTKLPDALAAEGKLEEPVEFASNQLVLAVPADGPASGRSPTSRPRASRSWSAPRACPSATTRARCSPTWAPERSKRDPRQRPVGGA